MFERASERTNERTNDFGLVWWYTLCLLLFAIPWFSNLVSLYFVLFLFRSCAEVSYIPEAGSTGSIHNCINTLQGISYSTGGTFGYIHCYDGMTGWVSEMTGQVMMMDDGVMGDFIGYLQVTYLVHYLLPQTPHSTSPWPWPSESYGGSVSRVTGVNDPSKSAYVYNQPYVIYIYIAEIRNQNNKHTCITTAL